MLYDYFILFSIFRFVIFSLVMLFFKLLSFYPFFFPNICSLAWKSMLQFICAVLLAYQISLNLDGLYQC